MLRNSVVPVLILGLASLSTPAFAHCRGGVPPHQHCKNPPPKISAPGINPTWKPKDSDFASKAEFNEAMASYQAEIAAARQKGLISGDKAATLRGNVQALKNSSRF